MEAYKELKKVLFYLVIDGVTDKQNKHEANKKVNDFCFYAVTAKVITAEQSEKLQNYCYELSNRILKVEDAEEFGKVIEEFSKRF